MKKTIAAVAVTAAVVLVPAGLAAAESTAPAAVAETGSASTGSAGLELLCQLLAMIKGGYVDSSGGGPRCATLSA